MVVFESCFDILTVAALFSSTSVSHVCQLVSLPR